MFDQRQKMPAEIRNFICTRTQSPQNRDKGFGTCRETKGRQLSSLPASCHPQVTCHSTSSPSPLLPKIGAALRMLFLQHIQHLPHQENPRLSLGRFSKEFFRWRKKAAKRSLRKVSLHHWPVLSNASPSGPDRLANFTNWSACHITGYLALFLPGHITQPRLKERGMGLTPRLAKQSGDPSSEQQHRWSSAASAALTTPVALSDRAMPVSGRLTHIL